MFHKILVALDNSELSQQVFDRAVFLAKSTNASLMLLHVQSAYDEYYLKPGFPGAEIYPSLYTQTSPTYMKQCEEMEKQGLEELKFLVGQAIAAGVKAEFIQNQGDPGRIICNAAISWQADLIIMGRRGRTGLSEWFLGSVSNYVLHHAPCAVLVVQHSASVNISEEAEAIDRLKC
jgi:nucleotide-binding universal stress UspA family protein